jgi:hypothetical protein
VGTASGAQILSLADGGKVITTDLTSTRTTIGQVDDSQKLSDATGRDLAIFNTFSYQQDGKGRVLSGTFDRVIFDRNTGVAYTCPDQYKQLCDEKTATTKVDPNQTDVLGTQNDLAFVYPGEDNFNGFQGQYFAMPFNTQKQTYQWWDGTLEKATDMKYVDTEQIDGVTVYKFVQTIPATNVGTQEIPASIANIDQPGNVTVDSIYSNIRTLWIEPETGFIIKGQEQQDNYFEYHGQRVLTTTKALVAYDDATIKDNVDTYGPKSTQLKLIRVWLPIGGLVLGLILLGLGIWMIASGRRSPGASDRVEDRPLVDA